MTTSPEALREAVERLTASANGENQLTIGRNVFVQMTDLTLVLSALQDARKALGPFAEQSERLHSGFDDSMAAGFQPMVPAFVKHIRRAAEVYRALSSDPEQPK